MSGPTLGDIVLGLLPLAVIMIGFWLMFAQPMRRQAQALERIAAALEKREP